MNVNETRSNYDDFNDKQIKNIMTNVYVTDKLLNDFIPIYDTKFVELESKKKYLLVFTTGKVTIPIFKMLFLKKKKIFFLVKNMELFNYKMKDFRMLNYIQIKNEDISNEKMEDKYLKIENDFKLRNGLSLDKLENGVNISFRPDIYASISTSLINHMIYKTDKLICHTLYNSLLKGPKRYEELKNKINSNDFENTLQSMLYSKIIKQTGDLLYINEILLKK